MTVGARATVVAGAPVVGTTTTDRPAAAVLPTRLAEPARVAEAPGPRPASTAPRVEPPATAVTGAPRPPSPPAPLPNPPAPPVITARRPRPRIVLGQLVCWQLALVAPLTVLGRGVALLVLVSVAAASAVLATACWTRGRWLHEWAWRAGCLAVHGRVRRVAVDHLLASLAPGTRLVPLQVGEHETVAVRSRTALAVVLRTHLLEVPPAASLLPVDRDLDYLARTIVHHVPGVPGEPPRCWLVLLVRPSAGRPDVAADLANATRRLLRTLDRAGTPAVPADATEIDAMVRTLLAVPDTGAVRWRERWDALHCGPLAHVCASVPGEGAPLGRWESVATAASVTVATTAAGPDDVRTVVRVASRDTLTARALLAGIPAAEVEYGRQLPGIRGCLPVGPALDIR